MFTSSIFESIKRLGIYFPQHKIVIEKSRDRACKIFSSLIGAIRSSNIETMQNIKLSSFISLIIDGSFFIIFFKKLLSCVGCNTFGKAFFGHDFYYTCFNFSGHQGNQETVLLMN